VEAVRNKMDAQRAYYLARGGIEAAIYSLILSGGVVPGGNAAEPEIVPGQRWASYEFEGGSAVVEVAPETAKLNINLATPEQIAALVQSLGVSVQESNELAAAIVHWREPAARDTKTALDNYYEGLAEPYRARHAALEQIEELLPVRGMSRDLMFGGVVRGPREEWNRRPPLADLLTTEQTYGAINPNFAAFEILRTLPGWNDGIALAVVAVREKVPFRTLEEMQAAVPAVASVMLLSPLTLTQGPVYTLTATGTVPGSSVKRSVRAVVRLGQNLPLYHEMSAWHDDWPFAQEPPAEWMARAEQGQETRR